MIANPYTVVWLLFEGGYYLRAAFISLGSRRIATTIGIGLHAGNTDRHDRCWQQYAQPLSPAVSRGNESQNTNRPRDSSVSVDGNYQYAHSCTAHTSRGYYLRVAFISLRAPNCAATIGGRQLFEGGV